MRFVKIKLGLFLLIAMLSGCAGHFRCLEYAETMCYPPVPSPMDYHNWPYFQDPYPCWECSQWEEIDPDHKAKSAERFKARLKEKLKESRTQFEREHDETNPSMGLDHDRIDRN